MVAKTSNYLVANSGYDTFADAYTAAKEAVTSNIKVLRDVTDSSSITLDTQDINLDLQSYTITGIFIKVSNGKTMTINGTGEIVHTSPPLCVGNGTLNVNSGSIRALQSNTPAIYTAETNTLINIGQASNATGELTPSITGTGYGIYDSNGGIVNVYSGSITATEDSSIGIQNYGGTVNIGLEIESLSTTTPAITGGKYGMCNNGGSKWTYKNGIIQGKTESFHDEDYTPNGGLEGGVRKDYIIVNGTSGDYKTSHLEKLTDVTSPWLPIGATYTNQDLNTGVTMKDSSNNEWTWVVVPKSVTASAAKIGTNENPTGSSLETTLKDYAATLVTNRGSYTDEWYSDDQTGLTSIQYADKKRKMLNGIKEYGGFWIGKYEAGYTEAPTSDNYQSTSRTAVIQKDAYPYNYITCSNANTKAIELATQANSRGSLLFGTQWDLTLGYLVNRGGVSKYSVTNDSTNWGNYYNKALTIDTPSIARYRSSDTSWPLCNDSTLNGTKPSSKSYLLTTGAAESTTKKLNIVDLAGNIQEYTMEYTGDSSYGPCGSRGGAENLSGGYNATCSNFMKSVWTSDREGFRPTLYEPLETAPTVKLTTGSYNGSTYTSGEYTDKDIYATIKNTANANVEKYLYSKDNGTTWNDMPESSIMEDYQLTNGTLKFKITKGIVQAYQIKVILSNGHETLPEVFTINRGTIPWLPEDASYTETDISKGLSIKDSYNNEWIWVIVPKHVTANATSSSDIEANLKSYAAEAVDNRGDSIDTWFSEEQSGETEESYNNLKNSMLQGIKQYGGFWIGKYETSHTEVPTSSNYNQTIRTAVIQQDAYPYSYITCANAEEKSKNLANQAGGIGSLLFGTQWDLTLKYLVEAGAIDLDEVDASTNWGNYIDSTFKIESPMARNRNSDTYWPMASGTKYVNSKYIYTTGVANSRNEKLGIIDLAGNVSEWTLEQTSGSMTTRGGWGYMTGNDYPSSTRQTLDGSSTTDVIYGFRSCMYMPMESAPTVKVTTGSYTGATYTSGEYTSSDVYVTITNNASSSVAKYQYSKDNGTTWNDMPEANIMEDYQLTNGTAKFKITKEIFKAYKIKAILSNGSETARTTTPLINKGSTPWLPEGASYTETDISKGISIKDSYNNEWTWVVVPKQVTSSASTDSDIESALISYAAETVNNSDRYTDTWNEALNDVESETSYNSLKSSMLQGIKTYGGFWIGKYEAGFFTDDIASDYKDEERTAVIQQDAYPYIYVTPIDAEIKSKKLANQAGGKGSLLFGTQWNLTLKYLVETGAINKYQVTDSTDWGNHSNAYFRIESSSAKYRINDTDWRSIIGTKSSSNLLTTGAANSRNGKLNIIDLAGNMMEWTLEYSSNTYQPCTIRGGHYRIRWVLWRYLV